MKPPIFTTRVPREELSEEQLADLQAKHLHGHGILYKLTALLILTVAAMVVVIPFIYMLLISLKGPAQVGNGRVLPEELIAFFRSKAAWVEVILDPEEAVAVNQLSSVPVLLTDASHFGPWPEPRPLPGGVENATTVSLERQSAVTQTISVLLQVRETEQQLAPGTEVTVFLPAKNQPFMWMPLEGRVIPRTLWSVLGRVLANYRVMTGWENLSSGHLLSWVSSGYPRWFINSLFVAISTVLLGLFFDSLAAFGFAKFEFPYKRPLFALLLATLMIPYPVTLVPTFFIFAELGFYNTYAALIVPGLVSAFGIFLVRQYMENIPDDMIAAARVDGASDFQVYRRVVLPTARPVLAALAVFRFIYQWNTYLYPLVLTNKDSMKTVQLGLATMEDMHGAVDYGLQMAGSALAVLPILIVYMFMQKHFIAGITLGSAKG